MNLNTEQMEALRVQEDMIRSAARKASRQMLEDLMAVLVDSVDSFQNRDDSHPEIELWTDLAIQYAKVA